MSRRWTLVCLLMAALIALPTGGIALAAQSGSAASVQHAKHHGKKKRKRKCKSGHGKKHKKKCKKHKKHKKGGGGGTTQPCRGAVGVGTTASTGSSTTEYSVKFGCNVPVSSFIVTVNRPVVAASRNTICGTSTPCAASGPKAKYSCTITGGDSYSCSGQTTQPGTSIITLFDSSYRDKCAGGDFPPSDLRVTVTVNGQPSKMGLDLCS